MERKIVSGIILTLLLTSVLTLAFNIKPVKASGTIYIRADGSIDPPTAPISTSDNATYYFTDNINDSIVVERNDIVINGLGYTLQGTGAGTGINLEGRDNVTIENTEIKAFMQGVCLYGSSYNSIMGNKITNNSGNGIYLRAWGPPSSYNSIVGNEITNNNGHGIYLYVFDWFSSSRNNSIMGNKITNNSGNGIYLYAYFKASLSYNSIAGNKITNNGGDGIYLNASNSASSSYNSIVENNITNNGRSGILTNPTWGSSCSYNNILRNNITDNGEIGIKLHVYSEYVSSSSSYNSIVENKIADNGRSGISLTAWPFVCSSWNNSVVGNKITNNGGDGIYLSASSYNSILGNNITNNTYGIGLYAYAYSSSSYNSIVGNKITNNSKGISLSWWDIGASVDHNDIVENKITNNGYGIDIFHYSTFPTNLIYHNDFVNNTNQAHTNGYRNEWHNGYPSGGNYWSNYAGADLFNGPYQNITGSDGIGDTPYTIDSNNVDNYPLMGAFSSLHSDATSASFQCVSNSTVSSFQLSGNTMSFDVSGEPETTGFCTVTILHSPLSPPYSVAVDGNPISYTTVFENETESVIYFTYQHSTHRIAVSGLVHDLALTSAASDMTVVGQGYNCTVSVTATNLGGYDETFNITAYANATSIGLQEITLASGGSTSITFTWNTTGFAYGNYTISAYAEPVLDETYVADNNVTWTVHVGVPGDVSGTTPGVYDGITNMKDVAYLVSLFNTRPSSPNWQPNADVNNDGFCNMKDIAIAIYYFNQHE